MTTEITTATNAGTIDLSIDVPGTVEQVWRAISSGPGISSWYVPHVVEERSGGHAVASFGPGPEMQIPGRVAVWEPQQRIVFDGGEDAGGGEVARHRVGDVASHARVGRRLVVAARVVATPDGAQPHDRSARQRGIW